MGKVMHNVSCAFLWVVRGLVGCGESLAGSVGVVVWPGDDIAVIQKPSGEGVCSDPSAPGGMGVVEARRC